MKKILILLFFPLIGLSQPSNTNSPPTTATGANKIGITGVAFTLNSLDTTQMQYQWYKLFNGAYIATTGVATKTVIPTAPGWYIFELQTTNTSGCQSIMSDPYSVYVFDPIKAIITGVASNCIGASATLVASGGTSYQWSRNNVIIPTATSSTFVATETNAGTYTYSCLVSNLGGSATATQKVTFSATVKAVIN